MTEKNPSSYSPEEIALWKSKFGDEATVPEYLVFNPALFSSPPTIKTSSPKKVKMEEVEGYPLAKTVPTRPVGSKKQVKPDNSPNFKHVDETELVILYMAGKPFMTRMTIGEITDGVRRMGRLISDDYIFEDLAYLGNENPFWKHFLKAFPPNARGRRQYAIIGIDRPLVKYAVQKTLEHAKAVIAFFDEEDVTGVYGTEPPPLILPVQNSSGVFPNPFPEHPPVDGGGRRPIDPIEFVNWEEWKAHVVAYEIWAFGSSISE